MKRIIALFALIAGIGPFIRAQDNSLLWKVSGKGLAKPSYLFGTIHLVCPEYFIWTPKMRKTLDASEQVCFELDLSDPGMMMTAMAGMMDSSGKKLEDYFTPEQYRQLAKYIKDSLQQDISPFEHMKPVMLETFLSSGKMDCDNPIVYEDSIMKIAQSENKKIMGLEKPQEQIDALGSIPLETVIKALMEDINGGGDGTDTEYQQMELAYKNQDLPGLYKMIINSPGLDQEKGPLLYDRNKKWVGRIASKMQGNSVFFAFGAGHLYGPQGIIQLLRKKGYTVKPLR